MQNPKSPINSPTSLTPVSGVSASYQPLYTHLRTLTRLLVERKIFSVMCTGDAGVGKTRTVTGVFKEHNLVEGRDYVHARGHASTVGFIRLLYENRDGSRIILADDIDSILLNSGNICKVALSERPATISFLSSRVPPDLEPTFTFNAPVVFISNLDLSKTKSPDLLAIQSRTFFVNLHLSRKQTLEYIYDNIVPHSFGATSLTDRQLVYELFRKSAESTEQRVDCRTYIQLLTLFEADQDVFPQMLEQTLRVSPELMLMRLCHDEGDTVEDSCRIWCRKTQRSRASFFWWKKKLGEYL